MEANINGDYVVPFQKLTEIRVIMGNSICLRDPVCLRLVYVCYSDDFNIWYSLIILDMMLPDLSNAYYSYSYLLLSHKDYPSIIFLRFFMQSSTHLRGG